MKISTIMVKGNKFFIFVSFCLILFSCDKERKDNVAFLKFVNNSEKKIDFYFSTDYPSTSIKNLQWGCDNIAPHSNCDSILNIHGWNYSNKEGILLFYILDSDTVTKYGYNNIQKSMILKQYQYTETELESMNWTITYP